MQLSPVEERRNIIPRWRSFERTLRAGELTVRRPREGEDAELRQAWEKIVSKWKATGTIAQALEAVSAAAVLGRSGEHAMRAAEEVLESPASEFPGTRAVARHVLGHAGREVAEETEDGTNIDLARKVDHEQEVHEIRRALRDEPRNSILWVELAREYTVLAVDQKAIRAMENALSLADDNRFVLRSAARFFVHLDDPERAHQILCTAGPVGQDPWLLASEIAVASVADRTSGLIKKGHQMLESDRWHPFNTNELASALATVELTQGSIRDSRQLFRTSLRRPNDNSVAQAEWASNEVGGFTVGDEQLSIRWSFEARARARYREGDFEGAVEECRAWHLDEPFSSRPAGSAAFLLAVGLQEFEESARWALIGLEANPRDQTLRNNLVFALASAGHLEEAKEELKKASVKDAPPSTQAAFKATQGLIHFREGRVEKGRELYREALEEGDSFPEYFSVLARLFLLREELLAGTENIAPHLEETRDDLASLSHPEELPYLTPLVEHLQSLAAKSLPLHLASPFSQNRPETD